MKMIERLFCTYISKYLDRMESLVESADPKLIFSFACLILQYFRITRNKQAIPRIKFLANHGEALILSGSSQNRIELLKCINLIEHLLRAKVFSSSSHFETFLFFRLLGVGRNKFRFSQHDKYRNDILLESAYYLSVIERVSQDSTINTIARINLNTLQQPLFLLSEDDNIESLLLYFMLALKMDDVKLLVAKIEEISEQYEKRIRVKYMEDRWLKNFNVLSIWKLLLAKEYLINCSLTSGKFLNLIDEILTTALASQKNFTRVPEDIVLSHALLYFNPAIDKDCELSKILKRDIENLNEIFLETTSHNEFLEVEIFCKTFFPIVLVHDNKLNLNDIISICV